tara:strand:- start:1970 stop:3316 length:1347 start_codon:yes stop_codon:yes gene_type:complete
MIKLDHLKQIYFLGIGGIGMSALARYFAKLNYEVAGYDKSSSAITRSLEQASCTVFNKDEVASIPSSFNNPNRVLIVYTPAISQHSTLFKYFKKQGYQLCKRAEILGAITQDKKCLAIAGTHGKTTISSMLSYMLSDNNVDCSAFLGGIATNFNSNLRIGLDDITVVEADEFDRSFLQLHPNWILISSTDADHLDIYGTQADLVSSFKLFSDKVSSRNLIVKEGLPIASEYTYALDSITADFSAQNIRVESGKYHFDIVHPKGVCTNVISGLPGIHNVENSIAAFSMAYFNGVKPKAITRSISSFLGVKRRFDIHVKTTNQVYIDDYAHHPKEIEMAIRSARDLYPNRELTVIFQPHLFSRTRDFMDDFAAALSAADCVMLLDVYAARELPINGVNSKVLLEKIKTKNKGLYTKEAFPEAIANTELLMTLGAGDVDTLIQPIKTLLTQ